MGLIGLRHIRSISYQCTNATRHALAFDAEQEEDNGVIAEVGPQCFIGLLLVVFHMRSLEKSRNKITLL